MPRAGAKAIDNPLARLNQPIPSAKRDLGMISAAIVAVEVPASPQPRPWPRRTRIISAMLPTMP